MQKLRSPVLGFIAWFMLVMSIAGPACTPKEAKRAVALATTAAPPFHPPAVQLRYRGVNMSGAEFGGAIPGVHGRDYLWPTPAHYDYFLARGVNVFRVGFRHERLQRALRGPLDETEWTRLLETVTYLRGKGATVILVPHNNGRFGGKVLTELEMGDFWGRVAVRLKDLDGDRVWLNLTNEPQGFPTETWAALANAGLKEVRRVGFTGRVLVPGSAWTGGGHWTEKFDGYTPNAIAMLKVVDPGSNMAFEVHQYLDADASGSGKECVSATIGTERLAGFVAWLRANGKLGFLGEVGAVNTPTCKAAVTNTIAGLEADYDVWLGWTAWGSGVWRFSTAEYPLSLGPTANGEAERAQFTWLKPFLPISCRAAP